MSDSARRLRAIALVMFAVLFAACGDMGSNPGSDPGTIALRLNSSVGATHQGGATQVAATLTRGGGFVGSVSFSVDGAPAGVMGTVGNVQTNGAVTTATVTFGVGPNVVAGVYPLTVTAHGTGVSDAAATFTLTVTPTSGAAYSITVAPTSLSILQGGSSPVTVTLDRAGFVGSVFLSLIGAPPGVSATFSANNLTRNTTNMTVVVGAFVAPGLYTIAVGGVAAGQPDKATPIQLTVGVSGTFTLSLTSNATTLTQGATTTIPVTVLRTDGPARNVALTVTGQPTGMTATFNPTTTADKSSILTLTTTAGFTPGIYALTLHGNTAGQAEQTVPLNVTVTASSGTGNVTVSFASCDASRKPIWFAYQDGSAAVIPVTATGDAYTFNIGSGKGGYFYVIFNASTEVIGRYHTQAELTASTLVECGAPAGSTKVVNGTVLGLAAGDKATLSLGGATHRTQTGANVPFAITGVADGTQDFIGYRENEAAPGTTDRMIIRRDLNIAPNGTLGVVDFGSAEAFAAAQATLTTPGAGAVNQFTMQYLSGAACSAARLYTHNASLTSLIFGVPVDRQRATDLHSLSLASYNNGVQRIVTENFRVFGNRSVTLGATPASPTLTTLAGGFRRMQAAFVIPSDYQTSANFVYGDDFGYVTMSIFASVGWLGGANATLALPDLGADASWNNAWAPAPLAGYWEVSMTGSNLIADNFCQDGGKISYASVSGFF